jgi:hypothetical protein
MTLIPGPVDGDWTVHGHVENVSPDGYAGVELKISLLGTNGEQLAETQAELSSGRIASGETRPYDVKFIAAGRVIEAQVSLERYERSSFQRAPVETELLLSRPIERGMTLITGVLRPGVDRPVEVERITLWTTDDEGNAIEMVGRADHLTWIDTESPSPFIALIPAGVATSDLLLIPDASETVFLPEPNLNLITPARLEQTTQGQIFALWEMINESSQPRNIAVLVALRSPQDELLSLAASVSPIALDIDETRAFAAVEFPGLSEHLAVADLDLDDIRVEILLDRAASSIASLPARPLLLIVDRYESFGSSLLLRGRVTNPGDQPVEDIVILGAVRSTAGKLLSAGWVRVQASLLADQQAPFVLALAFPRWADPSMSEFDLQAYSTTSD